MAFVFAIVRAGCEPWAKAEMARVAPEARVAYSRPGLLTWKSEALPRSLVLARVIGTGIGTRSSAAEVLDAAPAGRKLRLHVYPRERRGGDGDPALEDRARAEAIERELRAIAPERFEESSLAEDGDRVLDVIVGEDDPLYVGTHVHGRGALRWPGGWIPIEVPTEAPSRAYRKLEEVLAWSALPVRAGEVAIELGASPGGAAYALVRRGVSVIAIDPAPLDPVVLAYTGPSRARVRHLPIAAGGVRTEGLPVEARWLLSDLNLAPPVALRYVERIARALPGLRGLLLTLKLNDEEMVERIPDWLARVSALGMRDLRAIQLPSHRREIAVVAAR